MPKNPVAKHYDILTPHERFAAVVRALARGDNAEANRLSAACPKKQYTANDVAYAHRLEVSADLTLLAACCVMHRIGKLHMVAVMRYLLDEVINRAADVAAIAYELGYGNGTHAGWEAAGRKGAAPLIDSPADGAAQVEGAARELGVWFAEILDQLAVKMAGHARGPLDGFARFARAEWGMGPEVPLGAWAGSVLELLDQYRALLDAGEPDEAEAAELAEALTTVWRARLGIGDQGNER